MSAPRAPRTDDSLKFPIPFAYDASLKRPGCVILQVFFGGSRYVASRYFSTKSWLLNPTPNMKCYQINSME